MPLFRRHIFFVLMVSLACSGCAGSLARSVATPSEGLLPPTLNPVTQVNRSLRELPPPERRIAIAVYGYTDQTGQFKPAENVQTLSRAVTQGATSVLVKALQDAGNGSWFTVVERERLDNLLKERHIIADMRQRYLGENTTNPRALPPLLFAGVLLEGGIIGYDSNTRTGGAGAKYLGIGGDINYREDTVTIYLRAVSTKTGEVLISTVAHKTVVSVGIQGGAFKFVALDKILEAEAGFTRNEPEQIAVQQAIEKAVHAMIVEGADRRLWAFSDKAYQAHEISKLLDEQDGFGPLAQSVRGQANAAPAAVASTNPAAAPHAVAKADASNAKQAAESNSEKPPVPVPVRAADDAAPAAVPQRSASLQAGQSSDPDFMPAPARMGSPIPEDAQ